ncbi:MAG: Ig-like domain-containing protein [Verrucomicrobia bacterium]|nr:Ig-like domain-containing protein [Verrucomicrobiota bacterium]
MNTPRKLWSTLAAALLLTARLSAAPVTLNDGTTTANLAKISNANGTAGASVELLSTNGVLVAAQTFVSADFPLRAVWFPASRYATDAVYTVSADFKPQDVSPKNRGGVMGWFDLATQTGIGFVSSPSDDPTTGAFQLATVDFTAADDASNESLQHLFNLDGTPATSDVTSAWSDLSGYDATRFATFQLTFSKPTTAEQSALTNKATAHVTAKVMQLLGPTQTQVGRTLELLTDLPQPAGGNHRFGYHAYWASIFVEGSTIGQLDNLVFDGALGTAANLPPTVALTSPADGSVLGVPTDLTINATASDFDGSVQQVEFFANSVSLGAVSNTGVPFSLTWTNVPPNTYKLTSKATDNGGATAISTNLVSVTISNTPPTVSLRTPANGDTTVAPGAFTLAADASDVDGSISAVEFYAGTNFVGVGTSEPFSVAWTNVPAGTYAITAQAIDNWDAVTVSTELVTVTVTVPPTSEPPKLVIASANNSVTVSWPAATVGFKLQSNTNLLTGTWVDVPTASNPFTQAATNGTRFFRLKNL